MSFIIAVIVFITSGLTLYSGFGLSTVLMPILAVFFPITIAIGLTALIHLINNFFKLVLLWHDINWSVTWKFGTSAIIAAIAGSWVLISLSDLPILLSYKVVGKVAAITPIKMTVGILLIIFATVEFLPIGNKIKIPSSFLPLGGLLSGFFAGLSGHQGAFRSIFLVHMHLDKHAFIASNAAISAFIDIPRLIVYGTNITLLRNHVEVHIILIATISALAGTWVAKNKLKKITITDIQKLIAILVYALSILLILGLI